VRGFLESLQYEVSGFGVRVHLIEPGFIRTDLATSTARDITAIADYDHLRARLESQWRESIAREIKREAAEEKGPCAEAILRRTRGSAQGVSRKRSE